jgi:hypothetical protein
MYFLRGMRHTSTALYFYGASKKSLHQPRVTFGNMLFRISYSPNYCSGLVSQFCDVVLVRAHLAQENPQGVGILEWGGNGEGMETGRSVYEQPGTRVDGILSQQGGFPSK